MGSKKGRRSLNIFMCEIVYTAIVMNLPKHKSPRDTIYDFMGNSETFTALKEGKLHNDFINDTRKNNMVEPETGESFTEEDLKDMEQERDRIKLEINRVADSGERSEKTSTGYSDRAYKQIWRMCQAYEEWCINTEQPGPLPLNIIKQDQN